MAFDPIEQSAPTATSENGTPNLSVSMIAISIVAILALVGGGYWWWQNQKIKADRQAFFSEFEKAETELHRMGDYEKSIPALQALALKTETFSGSSKNLYYTKVQLRLAANLIGRNQEGDRAEAMRIYQNIVNDESFAPDLRAIALAEMASVMHWVSGPEELKQLVFAQPPYADLLAQEGGDVHAAIDRLYERSNELYPNALAKFQMALMKATHVVNMPGALDDHKEAQLKAISQLLKEGDELLEAYPYEQSYLAHMWLCRSMSLATVGRFLGTVPVEEIESSFKRALDESASAQETDFYSRSVGITTHLYYAQFLNNNEERFETSRKEDVKTQLNGYAASATTDPNYRIINEYIASVKDRTDADFFKSSLKRLAVTSPNFKEYLTGLGWSI